MKAIQISEYGHADKARVVEIDKPPVGPGQVLIEVYAASLNPFDTTMREGFVKDALPKLPITLGGDFAGVVSEVGQDVNHIKIGDKVYGQASVIAGNSGSLAEFAVTKAGQVAKMPVNLDFAEAASLPLVASSAYQALTEHIKLQSGKKLFIHGGSGGIGTLAIQIAKQIGAYVAASAKTDGTNIAKDCGADEVIDSDKQDFTEELNDFDAVFDTVGGDDFNRSLTILRPGGVAVSMIAKADEAKVNELGVTAISQSTYVTSKTLSAIRELVEQGAIKPQVTKLFSLEQIVEAFEARESGKAHGKVVVTIK